MSEKIKEYELSNGVRVGLSQTKEELTKITLRIRQGAIHEKEKERGLSHLLEHLTYNNETKDFKIKDIRKIKALTLNEGAFTTEKSTIYTAEILPNRIETILKLYSQQIKSKINNLKEFEKEKKIVQKEIDQRRSQSNQNKTQLNEEFYELLYKSINQNYTKPIKPDGNIEVIKNITLEDINKFKQEKYNSNNIDIVITGKLTPSIESIIQKEFSDISSGKKQEIKQINSKIIRSKNYRFKDESLINETNKEKSLARINYDIMLNGTKFTPKENAELYIASMILGKGINSKLFEEIREKQQLTYQINAYLINHQPQKSFKIDTYVSPNKTEYTLNEIDKVFEKFKSATISDDYFEIIREQMLLKKINTNEYQLENDNILHHWDNKEEYFDFNKSIEIINSIKKEDVIKTFKKYFPDKNNRLTIKIIYDPLLTEENFKNYQVDNKGIYQI